MAEHNVSRKSVFFVTKVPLSHLSCFPLLLLVICLPHVVSTTNTTSISHNRYHPSTIAGLTHRSIFSPSVAAHRSRYQSARDASPFPRSALTNQQTRVETSQHFDPRNNYRHGTASTSWTPPISSRNNPKFYSATTTNPRHTHQVVPPTTASDHTTASAGRRTAPHRADRGSSADLTGEGNSSPLMGVLFPDPEPFGGPASSAPDASSKGASMSKLDAMLSRLESTNDEMLEELQHERDQVAARRREHHQERINRHQSRRRRPHRRRDNDPQPRLNDNNNIDGSPFNLAGTSDVVPRHPNQQQHHRRNSQYNNAAMTPDSDVHHRPSGRGDESMTRVEVPHITGEEVPRITPDQGTPRNHQTRNNLHRSSIDHNDNQYYSPRGQGSSSDLPLEAELQDLGTPGEEEATFLEDADYQDEQAAKARGSGAHQHHVRERDAQSLRLASENVRYVMTNARCASPVRRCIDLSVNQTVIGKKYWPRCAIVSRCGEESGCCYSPDHVCTVAQSHLIDLYFFYVTFEANSRAGVDRLTFENHTKCECRPRPPSIPVATLPPPQPSPIYRPSYSNRQQDSPSEDRQEGGLQQPLGDQSEDVRGDHHGFEDNFRAEPLQPDVGSDEDASNNEISRDDRMRQPAPPSEPERHHTMPPSEPERNHVIGRGKDKPRGDGNAVKSLDPEAMTDSSMELKTTRSIASETTTAAAVIASESCTCPEVYSPSLSPAVPGSCECVCDTTTGNCRRLMKGKRYFNANDEKCILSGECGVPTCKFGPFLTNFKRCPRKREAKKGRSKP